MKRILAILALIALSAIGASAQVNTGIARRFVSYSTPPTCSASTAGFAYFDTDDFKFYYCNGTSWVDPLTGGVGGASNGEILFNSSGTVDGKAVNSTGTDVMMITCANTASNGYVPVTASGAWTCGLPSVALSTQAGANYTVLTGDRGKLITRTHSSAMTDTLAQAGAAGFESGFFTRYRNSDTADLLTINSTTSVFTGGGGTTALVLYPGQSVHLVSDGTNWLVLPYSSGATTIMFGEASAFNPTDGQTAYIGLGASNYSADTNGRRVIVAQSGIITKFIVACAVEGTLGTTEAVTYTLRVNGSDTAMTTTGTWAANPATTATATGAIAIVEGDLLVIKWVTPTFATDPTTVRCDAAIKIVY